VALATFSAFHACLPTTIPFLALPPPDEPRRRAAFTRLTLSAAAHRTLPATTRNLALPHYRHLSDWWLKPGLIQHYSPDAWESMFHYVYGALRLFQRFRVLRTFAGRQPVLQ